MNQPLTLKEVANYLYQPMSRLLAGSYDAGTSKELVEYYKPITTSETPLHYFVVYQDGIEVNKVWTIEEAVKAYNNI